MQRCGKETKNLNPYLNHCVVCNKTFHKVFLYNEHMNGKKHAKKKSQTPKTEVELLEELRVNASNWYSDDMKSCDVASPWNKDELSTLGLKYRHTTLHPSTMVHHLNCRQKARLWRYTRDALGNGNYTEVATILSAVDSEEDGHLRVKELFESFETYRALEHLLVSAQRTCQLAGTAQIDSVVEIACGHGLVSLLLAYRFPDIHFSLYDLEKRVSFDLYLKYFEKHGQKLKGKTSLVLPNITFHEADMRLAESVITASSMVVAIHGCNEVNQVSVEMALARGAAWAVMPCCIQKDLYLGRQCSMQLQDDGRDVRHSVMCGIIAERYGAQCISEIDRRITNRALLIAGGIAGSGSDDRQSSEAVSCSGIACEDTCTSNEHFVNCVSNRKDRLAMH